MAKPLRSRLPARVAGDLGLASSHPRLEQVLSVLGGAGQLVTNANSGDRRVTRPIVYDAADVATMAKGDIVLGVGLADDQRGAVRLVRDAAAHGAAAVALKLPDVSEELLDAASITNIALISVPREVPWGELHSLLSSAIAAAETTAVPASDTAAVSDLFTLSDLIAAELGGPIVIEDAQFRVVGYSCLPQPDDEGRRRAILGRRIPQEWLEHLTQSGLRRSLLSGDSVLSIDSGFEPGSRRRRVTAIRSGGELLGVLWVGEGAEPFPPDIDVAIRKAGRSVACCLLRMRAQHDRGRSRRSDLFRALLDGADVAAEIAETMHVSAENSCMVIAFRPVDAAAATPTRIERAVEMLSVHFEALHWPSVTTDRDATVYSMVAAPAELDDERLRQLVSDAAHRLEGTLRTPWRVGYGSTQAGLTRARSSRTEADQVLDVLAKVSDNSDVGGIDELRDLVVLTEVEHFLKQHPSLLEGRVAALADHDVQHNTSYVDTLRAYLDNFGDFAAGASTMHLHVNSFRYRIRRLCEISGLNVNDPVHRLVAELQLRSLADTERSGVAAR